MRKVLLSKGGKSGTERCASDVNFSSTDNSGVSTHVLEVWLFWMTGWCKLGDASSTTHALTVDTTTTQDQFVARKNHRGASSLQPLTQYPHHSV